MNTEKRRVPLTLQEIFVASNRGQEIDVPPPGNVAIRVFQSIFHRPIGRQISRREKHTEKVNEKGVSSTAYSSDGDGLSKPACYQLTAVSCADQRCSIEDIETPRPTRDEYVEFPSANSGRSNATTIACSIDSEESNDDNLYFSPKKYKTKPKIKSMVSFPTLQHPRTSIPDQ